MKRLDLFKNIKPDAHKKSVFRNFLLSKFSGNIGFSEVKNSGFFSFFGGMPKMTASLLSVAVVVSSFSGVAFASQSSLPGDSLYGVKLMTENAMVSLTKNDLKKAGLHLEFAQKRLAELEELSNSNAVSHEIVASVLSAYKEQLAKSANLLADPSVPVKDVASVIDLSTSQNKETITNLAAHLGESEEVEVSDAYEKTEDANDHANLTLIALASNVATSTSSTTATSTASTSTTTPDASTRTSSEPQSNSSAQSAIATTTPQTTATSTPTHMGDDEEEHGLMERSAKKINSVEHKTSEVQRYIDKKSDKYDVSFAQAALDAAESTLSEATALMNDGDYLNSFKTAMLAQKQAQEAKKMIEKDKKEKKEESRKEGKDEDASAGSAREHELNFKRSPSAATQTNNTTSANTANTATSNTTTATSTTDASARTSNEPQSNSSAQSATATTTSQTTVSSSIENSQDQNGKNNESEISKLKSEEYDKDKKDEGKNEKKSWTESIKDFFREDR